MLFSVAAALLVASPASAVVIYACPAPPPPPKCSTYTIINARGTGEDQGPSVGFITMNGKVMTAKSGGSIVSAAPICIENDYQLGIEYNVVYPAALDQNSAPGTTDVVNQVAKILAQDKSTCIILEGYSQGATVIVDALPKLTGAAFDAVKGVFLIGDTKHEPGLACNVDMQGGDATKYARGDLYSNGNGIPADWVSKSLDVCNIGDSVCDVAAGNGTTITTQHLEYPIDAGLQNMGAEFVLKQLG